MISEVDISSYFLPLPFLLLRLTYFYFLPFLLIDLFYIKQRIFFSNNHCKCIPVCNHFYNSIYGIFWSLELFFILYSYVNKSFPSSNTFLNNLFFLKYLKAHFYPLFNYFMCNSWVSLGMFCLVKTKTVSSKPRVEMRNKPDHGLCPSPPSPLPADCLKYYPITTYTPGT